MTIPTGMLKTDMLPNEIPVAGGGLQMEQLRQQQHQQVVKVNLTSHKDGESSFFGASQHLQQQQQQMLPVIPSSLPHDGHLSVGLGSSSMQGSLISYQAPPTLLSSARMTGSGGSPGSSQPAGSNFSLFQHLLGGSSSGNADWTSSSGIGSQMTASVGLPGMDILPRNNAKAVVGGLHIQPVRQQQQVVKPSLPFHKSIEGSLSSPCQQSQQQLQQQQMSHMIPSAIVPDNHIGSEGGNPNKQGSPTLPYAPSSNLFGNVHLTGTSSAGSNFSTFQQLGDQMVDSIVDKTFNSATGPHKTSGLVSGACMTSGMLKMDVLLSSNVQSVSSSLQMQQLRQQQSSEASFSGPSEHLQQQNQQKLLLQQHQQQILQQQQLLQKHQQEQQQMLHPKQQPFSQQDNVGFTHHQLYVLRSQILAFRRIKKNERLSDELLRAIVSLPPNPPGAVSPQKQMAVAPLSMSDQGLSSVSLPSASLHGTSTSADHNEEKLQLVSSTEDISVRKGPEALNNQDAQGIPWQSPTAMDMEVSPAPGKQHNQVPAVTIKSEPIVKVESKLDAVSAGGKGHLAISMASIPSVSSGDMKGTSSMTTIAMPVRRSGQAKAIHHYRGPLFDFPSVSKRAEGSTSFSALVSSWGESLAIGYDVRVLLLEEGVRAVDRRRSEKLKKIERLLKAGSNSEVLHPDHRLKLRIEQRKLRLMELQSRVRDEVEEQQQEIMAMGERAYRKFVRLCGRQRAELTRHVLMLQKSNREKQLKLVFQWRKKLLEIQWVTRDSRISRNRGVAKYHERMMREFSKKRDEDRTKRMEALKNNDVVAYREILLQQQTQMSGDAGERFEVLSSFLTQTEEYLQKLGGKISAAKNQQEQEEAARFAAAAARAQGFSEEEIAKAAACAGEEVSRRDWPEDNSALEGSSLNRYYSLAHAVNEKVVRQPLMLQAGQLRDYQLVGLQWMLSLYNNRLNGILADEMGLGKTVQVMALIAYLMEFKGNYGPHLIIVPNAVMVNWKSELLRWLPSVSCIFYVGGKDARSRIFAQEVTAMKFNVLVTTYEFIMRDRAKLSKVDWKYMIIDEAQRMKDRESRLARDLDRFRCQRRLLLTGTPLQNDLNELWSLLNLLLPDVFDSSKAFNDWFAKPFQRDGPPGQSDEDDWLETEKKVIVIHRLHQILEPFMLRRRVEDVEGSLPPKVSVILKCKMSGLQAAIYDWVKATGTIRLDPLDEAQRVAGNSKRQIRAYAPLQNKCMELRKICNHPYLNYPPGGLVMSNSIVKSCGKLWILDRILMKLRRTGHRVLLFSTMTRLLDILEEYLQWRRLKYRRIDGTTTLEAREAAIVDFNAPSSEIFLFLLSIRAAGRGLNLQTADTVVIYDPDPNPKNEEQAVARAHRIGQKREVRVIYMEAVVETIASYQREDEIRSGGTVDSDDELAGRDRFVGSVESLVRNNIQQHKIDMADEVINAGRFDQQTSQEERRLTLEALLHDEERYQETVHDVPTLQEVNRMIARTNEEVELFDQMDEEEDWPGDLIQHQEIPSWLRVGSQEVKAAIVATSKQAMKQGLVGVIGTKAEEERVLAKAIKAKLLSLKRKAASDEDMKSFGSSEFLNGTKKVKTKKLREGTVSRLPWVEIGQSEKSVKEETREEEGDIAEAYDLGNIVPTEADLEEGEMEQEAQVEDYDDSSFVEDDPEAEAEAEEVEEEVEDHGHPSSIYSDDGQFTRSLPMDTNYRSGLNGQVRRFGSLAAIESRPFKQGVQEDLEDGEIVVYDDESPDTLRSVSWGREKDDGQGEQVVQPSQRKRKRSNRNSRSTQFIGTSNKSNAGVIGINPMYSFPTQIPRFDPRQGPQVRRADAVDMQCERPFQWGLRTHLTQLIPPSVCSQPFDNLDTARGAHSVFKHSWGSGFQEPVEDTRLAHGNTLANTNVVGHGNVLTYSKAQANWIATGRMQENQQKKCKAVLGKLQGAVNKQGRTIAAMFMELPKRSECPDYYQVISKPIDARIIEHRLDHFEYPGVLDFVADVQLMLDNAARYNFSSEVQSDARRLQALFFQRMGLQFPDIDFSSVRLKSVAVSSHPMTGVSKIDPTLVNSGARNRESSENTEVPRSRGNSGVALPRRSSGRPPVKLPTLAGDVELCTKEGAINTEKSKKNRKDMKKRPPSQKDDKLGSERVEEILHPVDLLVHKKKRNSRERVAIKTPVSKVFHDRIIEKEVSEGIVKDGSSVRVTSDRTNLPLLDKLPKGNPTDSEKGGFSGISRSGRRTVPKSVLKFSQGSSSKQRR